MKTTIIKGLTVLGIGAVIFGIGAATPAKADGWHDRRRVEVVPAARVVLGIGPIQVVAPCAPVVVVDRGRDHDWRWRRDHCR
jgi:hypothetical protein